MKISDEKDKYCCRRKYKDENQNNEEKEYCASISEFEFNDLENYIEYKKANTYNDLRIQCSDSIIDEFHSNQSLAYTFF